MQKRAEEITLHGMNDHHAAGRLAEHLGVKECWVAQAVQEIQDIVSNAVSGDL